MEGKIKNKKEFFVRSVNYLLRESHLKQQRKQEGHSHPVQNFADQSRRVRMRTFLLIKPLKAIRV